MPAEIQPAARPDRRLLRGLRAGLAVVVGTLVSAAGSDARAGAGDLEVGPWLGWAAGWQWRGAAQQDAASLNVGLDATSLFSTFGGSGYGGPFELRLGSWGAYDALVDGSGALEGGVVMLLTQTVHAQWGTFGVRVGAGQGGDRVTHFVVTFSGGVRYVPARAGHADPGVFAGATGVRIVATIRRTIDPFDATALLFGIEFEPKFFLPPYSLFKWGGHH